MKFEYDPPSGPSNMLKHDEQDLKHKLRIASNNLIEGEPEENLVDGELYWKNDDPEAGQRTLYAKRTDGLVKIVTLDTDNTPIFPGLNEVDLGTKEVIGFLPLSKLSKGVESSIDNITNLVVVTASGDIKVLSKSSFVIALTSNQLTGILPLSKGGTGKTTAAEAYAALGGKALGKLDSLALTDAKLTGILPLSKGGTGANTAQVAANNMLKSVSTASTLATSAYALILDNNVVKKILASKLGGSVEVIETTYATWEVGLVTITGTLKGELTSVYKSPNMGNPNGTQECNPSSIIFPIEVTGTYKVSGDLPKSEFKMQVLADGRIRFSYTGYEDGVKCSLAGITVKATRK